MTKKHYTEEFKQQAVELAERLGSVKQAAIQLGVSDMSISNWKQKLKAAGAAIAATESEELKRLRKEVSDLKQVNLILKRAAAFFSQDSLK